MSAATATESKTTLPKAVFDVKVENHELLKKAYLSYLAELRSAYPRTKTKGLVSGGGRKPHKQKGTGRARTGSIRNPIWRGGGITFGPIGNQNHSIVISTQSKRTAIRQALSLASKEGVVQIIPNFSCPNGQTKEATAFLQKHKALRNTLIVVDAKDELTSRATNNLQGVVVVQATYLNVYNVMNAHHILITKKALPLIEAWLSPVGAAK